jgi:two-component system cell cycle sensor histidine kinase/response regulator CckA
MAVVIDPLRILLVADSETDAQRVLGALGGLGRSVESRRVADEATFRTRLKTERWDAVVGSWSMPTLSGSDALRALSELELDIPFVAVADASGEEVAIAALRAGARDYVLTEKMWRLVPALKRELCEAGRRAAHRATEAKLRAQDARLRALVENSREGIVLTTREGNTLYMSPSARRLLGIEGRDDVPAIDLIHPDDRARVARERAKILETPNESAVAEFRVVRPDGSVRHLSSVATNRLQEPGLEAVVVNFQDVTESRVAREALRWSDARFERLSASGIIGIAVSSLKTLVITEANDTYLRAVGYSRDELLAGRIRASNLSPPESAELNLGLRAELMRTGAFAPVELELVRGDGTRLWVLAGAALLEEDQIITFIVDLTARKATEEALRKSEAQGRQTQKMEAIGGLAAGVAHDFNNLLSVILGHSLMLSRDLRPGDPMRDGLEEITSAGKSAAELTAQLLAFGRRQVLQPRVLDLGGIVRKLEKMIRRLIGEDIQLEVIAAPDLGNALIDPGQLEQVLMNLVVNARDAMPKGGKLTIETVNRSLDETYVAAHEGSRCGPHVMLAVKDTGTGMDAETQKRIFEPFFTTKEAGKGTGLGLSTVFGIVEQSGGTVSVSSEVRGGTTMTIHFPRTDREKDHTEVKTGETAVVRGGTETILLVEDDARVRHVTRAILRPLGYDVIDAENGGDALLVCEQHAATIDLLLTDVIMPRMSGRALAERLQVLRPKMKVIFVSGYTDDSIIQHGVLAPGIAFLQKPIQPDDLARKVREVLDACA